MRLVHIKLDDLVKPEEFTLTSQDDLFDRLVEKINKELQSESGSETEIFETTDAHVEISLTNYDCDDEVFDTVTPEMVEAIDALYRQVGWAKVTYEHKEETEGEYESHDFNFYFKTIPGVSL